MTTTPSPKHVFMSYSRKDEAVMRRIATFLREQGINVWVDNEKLVPGTPIWEEEIEKAIIGAGAVVVLLSPDSKNSPWVRREISYAEDNEIRIFPILIDGDERNAIPIRLASHQRNDIRNKKINSLNSLITALSLYFEELETQEPRKRNETENISQQKNDEYKKSRIIAKGLNKKFEETEIRFKELKAQFIAGIIPDAEFKSQLEELMVQDEQGSWWMIGYKTEQWYRHDGKDWVLDNPPRSSLTQ